ncbi:MAG: ECF-type sigma factor [Phycisphaerae bacterium]|nr:ECF-type sigma factor [Tepidisphaeraceae bacterium]
MPEVTHILRAIDSGDVQAAADLLPLVYEELRKLAAHRMSRESSDHTLAPTALVHEAYIRLVGKDDPGWQNRGHFFAAAAEAMRRILVDHARHKNADKRGGDWGRVSLDAAGPLASTQSDDLLLLDETLRELTRRDPLGGRLVELRYFAGLSTEDAAKMMGISAATAFRHWSFARAWLHSTMGVSGPSPAE